MEKDNRILSWDQLRETLKNIPNGRVASWLFEHIAAQDEQIEKLKNRIESLQSAKRDVLGNIKTKANYHYCSSCIFEEKPDGSCLIKGCCPSSWNTEEIKRRLNEDEGKYN